LKYNDDDLMSLRMMI